MLIAIHPKAFLPPNDFPSRDNFREQTGMKKTVGTKLTLLVAMGSLAVVSCAKSDKKKPDASSKPAAEEVIKEEDTDYKNVETNEFTSQVGDGRSVAWATWANVYDGIDFTKLRAKTVQHYGIPNNTDFTFLNPVGDRKSLWTFTNFQDSVAVKDIVAGVKRACTLEGYTSYLACVDDAIYKSGSVVFEMKMKTGVSTDPNHDGHIKDALYGLLGATFINVPDHNGVMEERMSVACVSCHSSKQTKVGANGIANLMLNLQGDNSSGDALAKANYAARFEQIKGYINDPADPIWAISEETKAGGYLAAQYMILKDQHGHQYNINDTRLTSEREKVNMKSAVDAGWVSAFANWITTAKRMCNSFDAGSATDPLGCGQKLDTGTDPVIAINTEKTTAKNILLTRNNILTPWAQEAPLRSQRPTYWVDQGGYGGGNYESINFALDYVTYYGGLGSSPMVAALPYLLSATSISFVMPGVVDEPLAKKWYGATATAASADMQVKKFLPRTIIKNYTVDALAYHTARYRYPDAMPANYLQTVSYADLLGAGTEFLNSCATCHSNAILSFNEYDPQLSACRGKASCVVKGSSQTNSGFRLDTPTSAWAKKVLFSMETLPSGMNGAYDWMYLATDTKSTPKRIPLLRRSALGLWSFLDYEQAIRPKALRHGPAYALLSPKMNLDRSVQPVTVSLTWDFDKNGVVGLEKMFCLQTDMFDLNRDGIAETNCFDSIQTLSGGTPRPVGKSDSLTAVHDLVYTPLSDTARRARLAKLIAAYGDGGVNVVWEDSSKTQINFFPEINSTEAGNLDSGYGIDGSGSGGSTTSGPTSGY